MLKQKSDVRIKLREINLKTVTFLMTILIILTLFMMSGEISAHRMIIEEVSEGKIEVGFDDGSKADNVEVKLYDEEENIIEEGLTDEKGIYEYDGNLEVERIVARDDMGHRAALNIGDDQENENLIQAQPLWFRTILGVGLVLMISVLGKLFLRGRT